MDKKKLLFIVGIVLIVILGVIAINMSKKKAKPEVIDELNENILKDTIVEGIKIADQSVITENGLSSYTAILTNTLTENKHIDSFYIVFTLNGEEIESLAVTNVDIKANGILPISLVFDQDISKATKVEYKLTND